MKWILALVMFLTLFAPAVLAQEELISATPSAEVYESSTEAEAVNVLSVETEFDSEMNLTDDSDSNSFFEQIIAKVSLFVSSFLRYEP